MGDRYRPPSGRALRWVETALGHSARIVAVSRLVGGLTADMDRLTVSRSGDRFDVVLRRWSEDGAWARGLVDREMTALTALAGHDLPVPRLLDADRSGDQAGVPSLLMTALAGEPLLEPSGLAGCLRQLAAMLVRIHDVPVRLEATDPHAYDAKADRRWISDSGLARAVVEAAAGSRGRPHVFVHGDYHQLNVLWLDRRLSGVVDWTYTGSGPREIDVGHCRLILAVLFSPEAAETFLRCYEAEAGLRIDPRADLRALLSFGPNWLEFVPRLVAGRAPVGLAGMTDRVEQVLRAAVARLG